MIEKFSMNFSKKLKWFLSQKGWALNSGTISGQNFWNSCPMSGLFLPFNLFKSQARPLSKNDLSIIIISWIENKLLDNTNWRYII